MVFQLFSRFVSKNLIKKTDVYRILLVFKVCCFLKGDEYVCFLLVVFGVCFWELPILFARGPLSKSLGHLRSTSCQANSLQNPCVDGVSRTYILTYPVLLFFLQHCCALLRGLLRMTNFCALEAASETDTKDLGDAPFFAEQKIGHSTKVS